MLLLLVDRMLVGDVVGVVSHGFGRMTDNHTFDAFSLDDPCCVQLVALVNHLVAAGVVDVVDAVLGDDRVLAAAVAHLEFGVRDARWHSRWYAGWPARGIDVSVLVELPAVDLRVELERTLRWLATSSSGDAGRVRRLAREMRFPANDPDGLADVWASYESARRVSPPDQKPRAPRTDAGRRGWGA